MFKLWFILSTMSDIYSKPNAISGSIPCKYCKRLTSFHDDLPDTDWRRECCSRSCYDTWQANKGTPGKVEEKTNTPVLSHEVIKTFGYFGVEKNMMVEMHYDGATNKRKKIKVYKKGCTVDPPLNWREETLQEFLDILKQADKM